MIPFTGSVAPDQLSSHTERGRGRKVILLVDLMVRESNQCEFDAIIMPITFYDLSKLFKSFKNFLATLLRPPSPTRVWWKLYRSMDMSGLLAGWWCRASGSWDTQKFTFSSVSSSFHNCLFCPKNRRRSEFGDDSDKSIEGKVLNKIRSYTRNLIYISFPFLQTTMMMIRTIMWDEEFDGGFTSAPLNPQL